MIRQILCVRETEELKQYAAANRLPYEIVASAEEVVPKDPYKLIALTTSEREKNLKFRERSLHRWPEKYRASFRMTVIRKSYRKVFQKALRSDGSVIMLGYRLKIPLQPGMRRTTLKC